MEESPVIRPHARNEFYPAKLSAMRSRIGGSSRLFLGGFASCILSILVSAQARPDTNSPYYGGDGGGMRYSRLTQFNPGHASRLTIAWIFHSGDVSYGKYGTQRSG